MSRVILEPNQVNVQPLPWIKYVQLVTEESDGVQQALEGAQDAHKEEVRALVEAYDLTRRSSLLPSRCAS